MKKYHILFCLLLCVMTLNAYTEVILHEYPRICPKSDIYSVKINDEEAFVYYATKASFVSYESDEPVDVEIHIKEQFRNFRVLPLSLGIKPEHDGQTIRFKLPPSAKAYLEIDFDEHLFLYGNSITQNKPNPDTPGLHYFKTGQVYEVGELVLQENEALYIEAGAVVRGQVRATRANNVSIGGLGVIDGGYYTRRDRPRILLIEDSRNTTIKDLIFIEAPQWVITLYYSEGIDIDNIKQISYGASTDGIDVVSSHDVTIKNCIIRNGDDCIVIKAFKNRYRKYCDIVQNTHLSGVDNVLVSGCAIQTNLGGHVFEIGHELLENPIRNIRFIDCDVLGAHMHGGVFGIHNADDAQVEHIVFKNIRVDHYYNKLIDMRILKSRYSESEERGSASNILFKDIYVTVSNANPGYSLSFIAGYDEDHRITNVTFDNFQLNGIIVRHPDQLEMFLKYTDNIIFK